MVLFILTVGKASAADPEEEKTGAIRGKVYTSDAKAAADVLVLIRETNTTTVTGDDGSFVFYHITPGSYDLTVSVTGHNTVVERITVSGGKTTNISLKLTASSKALQEVVITGAQQRLTRASTYDVAKMPLKNMENPQVYSTITKDLLQQQQVFSVDDAMQNATGITKMWDASGRGGDGGSYYNSRGFIVQSQLRNGVAGNVTSRIDAANLERIEVIKGPSATLFGSSLTSYGGLINRVTKKPYDHFGGEAGFAAGSYGFKRFSADVNTPLDKDRTVLLRVNAAYNDEGSFRDYGFNRNIALAPSISYRANDRLSFNFDVEYFAGQNTGLGVFFFSPGQKIADLGTDRADKLPIDYKRAYSSNDLYQTSRVTNLVGQMNYKLSDQWSMQTNFTSTNSFSDGPSPYFYLLTDAQVKPGAAPGANYISRNDQLTNNSRDQVTEIQQNFNGDFKIGSLRNRFVGGLDFFHHHSDQFFAGNTYDTIPSHGYIPTYQDFNRRNLDKVYDTKGYAFTYPQKFIANTYSTYISDVLNITDNLLVQAGLRLDYYDFKGNYNDATGTYAGGYTQTALSPKFGIVYQPVKDIVSLFANYQNGFTNKQGVTATGKAFKPEQANQLEGGMKLALLAGKLTASLSYYEIRVKDVIRADADHPNFSVQDGTQYSKGIEAEVVASPLRGLDIVAGYAYNDSKYEKIGKNLDGLRPATAGAPSVANLWVSYRIGKGLVKGLGFGIGGMYASDNKVVNDANLGAFILPAYAVLNSSVFYETTRLRLGIKVNNLTNKEYWIGYSTVNPQQLRSFNGSIAFKF